MSTGRKTVALGGAVVAAAGLAATVAVVSLQGDREPRQPVALTVPIQAPPGWRTLMEGAVTMATEGSQGCCYSPTTGTYRPLLLMMGERPETGCTVTTSEVVGGQKVRIGDWTYRAPGQCPEAGTGELPTPSPTPVNTPTPSPTEVPTPVPTVPVTPTPGPTGCCPMTVVIDWRQYSPAPLLIQVQAVAGCAGGQVLVDGGVVTLGPYEVTRLTPRVPPVIGAGVELDGQMAQIVGGMERWSAIMPVRLRPTR